LKDFFIQKRKFVEKTVIKPQKLKYEYFEKRTKERAGQKRQDSVKSKEEPPQSGDSSVVWSMI
jgi:hypothetical protein